MDEDAHEVRRGGKLIDLSPTEFNLLRYLMTNAGRVVSKAQILDRVWSYDFGGDGRIVESYVYYLRRKIDKNAPALIHTVRGVRVCAATAARWRRVMSRLRAAASRLRPPLARGLQPARRLRRWREWTLRTRLVVSMAVLTAVALVAANTVGVLFLRSYLINRVDHQIVAAGAGRPGPRGSGHAACSASCRVRAMASARIFGCWRSRPTARSSRWTPAYRVAANATDSTGPDLGSWDDAAQPP